MKATFVQLREKSSEIIRALNRSESITVFYRGKAKAIMRPLSADDTAGRCSAMAHPAFGLWADRTDQADPVGYVQTLRQGRFHAR